MLAFVLSAVINSALACGDKPCSEAACQVPGSTESAANPAGSTVAKLKVSGMKCGACAEKVRAALNGVGGVTATNLDVTAGTAEVGYDAAKTKVDTLIAAVDATGHFTASSL
ncbi:MAG: heavy-metal-associated domain-containing protein [Deltaproteobacteria bacterium]|nr:heavy-metal-associated domain-containing protein [Deltaproteobacteria bacterium]